MIIFRNLSDAAPYKKFKDTYHKALKNNEKNIEAACISSYNTNNKEISSRFVNIKYINDDKLYFYTNYNSPKAKDFINHNQTAINFFWKTLNVQIRILGHIKKTSSKESDEYFKKRDINKNSLAISSNQSEQIKSYADIRKNFYDVLESKKIDKCKRPNFWGGYYILPYYFEFWIGDDHRLNRRKAFELNGKNWITYFLQP